MRWIAFVIATQFAVTLLPSLAAFGQSVQPAPVDDPSTLDQTLRGSDSGLEERAIAFVSALNEAVSDSDEAALLAIAKSYAPVVDFYGKPQTAEAILKEKNAIFRRWPERSYAVVDGQSNADCDVTGRTCKVSALVRWKVKSNARKAESSGISRMIFQIGFSDLGPLIVGESGETLLRE